jgi:hypothetical protein
MTKSKSPWLAGTYEMIVQRDPEGERGDLLITVWGVPKTWAKIQGVPGALMLAKMDVRREEYDKLPPLELRGSQYIGKKAVMQPEDVEELYGGRLGLMILLALFQAAERDFWGLDMKDVVVREQRKGAFPIMERTHDLLAVLKIKIYDM